MDITREAPIYSICIPTYRRPGQVERLLGMFSDICASENLGDNIELCISDNNENEETKKIVDGYREKGLLRIRYHRWGGNVGYDKNALMALSLATGKYVHDVSDEIKFTKDGLAGLVKLLENSGDGVYLSSKGNGASMNPKELLAGFFSVGGIANYFGTYMGILVMKREIVHNFLAEHDKDMGRYAGKAFIHLPIFIYFLQRAGKLSFCRMSFDLGQQTVLLPSKKSELYIRHYYALIKECHGTGIIDDNAFRSFRRKFVLVFPFLLLKIRMYMPPSVYGGEIASVEKDVRWLRGEFSGAASVVFFISEVLLMNKFIPYHWLYLGWYYFKKNIRKDPASVNLFDNYV